MWWATRVRRLVAGPSSRRRLVLIDGIDPQTGFKYGLSGRYNARSSERRVFNVDRFCPFEVRGIWIWSFDSSVARNLSLSRLQRTPYRVLTDDEVQGLPLTEREIDLLLSQHQLQPGGFDWRPGEAVPEDYNY